MLTRLHIESTLYRTPLLTYTPAKVNYSYYLLVDAFQKYHPARIRTWNPLIRSQMPYPLVQRTAIFRQDFVVYINYFLLSCQETCINTFLKQSVMAKMIKVETLAIFKLSEVDHDRNSRPQMFHRVTALKSFTKIRKIPRMELSSQ